MTVPGKAEPAWDVDRLLRGAAALEIELPPAAAGVLLQYLEHVFAANRTLNLTRITDRRDAVELHLLDSLAGLRGLAALADGAAVVDVGTGAGFPGVPLACARPRWRLCLVEAARKKAMFVRSAAAAAGLGNVDVRWGRAETLGRDASWRERFDAAVARALAPLAVLAELALPFVRTGGVLVAYKGGEIEEEVASGRRALEELGGTLEGVDRFRLPWSGAARSLVIVRKQRPTPAQYPRRPGMPEKRPLGGGRSPRGR